MKTKISQKAILGIGAAAAVVVVGLLIYFLRASDPASQAPIPYKKFDYAAHMQQTNQQAQHSPSVPGASH